MQSHATPDPPRSLFTMLFRVFGVGVHGDALHACNNQVDQAFQDRVSGLGLPAINVSSTMHIGQLAQGDFQHCH